MPQSTEEYVTVLSVESVVESDNCSADDDDDDSSNFVTVLRVGEQLETVNEADDENGQVVNEVVKIYRLPGERLGMGLKFVGGVSVDETIERLFIQSIAADSPADRTKGINGKLREGDEILKIDGRDVDSMTRLECVAVLREATVCISVTVSHVNESSLKRKPNGPPPPVPPRKTSKLSKQVDLNERLREERSKLKPPPPVPQIREANNGGEEDRGEVAEVDGKVEDDNRLVPPEPSAVYTDIISEENVFVFDSESDDTGSSVSTVISRAPSSCASTTDSTLADGSSLSNGEMLPASLRYGDQMIQDYDSLQNHPFDLDLVLSPFEELERELALDDNGHPTFVFDEEGAVADEDLFKCLDEAIDAVDDDDEITIEPPECFQDDSGIAVAKIESEIVRNVGGGGELTCFRNTRELSRELCDESTDATRDSEDVKNESLILEDLRTPEKLKNQCMKAIKIVACRDGAISDELERTERAQSDGPCQTIDDDSAKCDTTEEDDGITEDVPEDVSEKPPPVPPPRRKSLSRDNKKSKNDDDDGDGSPTDPDQERIGDVPAEYDPGISTGDLDAECRKLDQRTLESGPSDDVAGSDLIAEDVCNNREKHADSEEYDDDDDDDQILLILRDSNHPNYCSNDEDDVKNTDGMMIQSRMMSIEDTVTASYDDDEEKRCDADFQDYSAKNTSQDSNRNDDSTTNASLETQTSNHHDDTHAYRTDSSHKLRDCDDVISFDAHHLKMNGSVGSTFNGCDCFESSTLVYHNRQPPDGHEFPPRYYDTCDNQFNFEKMKEFKCNLQHHCNSSNPVRPPAVSIAYMTECIDPKEYRQSSRQSLAKSEPPPPLPTVPPPPPQTDSPNEDKSFPAIVGCLTKGQTVKPPGNVENFNLSSDFSKSSPFYRSMTHESESSRQPRWKSEENLRNTIPRNPDNKPVSVKERIAMFSAHSDTSGTQTLPPRAKKSPARVEERICKVEANNEVSSTVGRGLDWTDGTSYTLPSFDAERPLLSKMDKSKSVENLDSVQMRSTSFDGTISPGIINKRNDSNDRKKFAVSEDHPVQMKRRESFSGYISSYPESQLAGYRYSNYPTTSNGLRTGCLPQTPTSAAVMNLLESRRLGASKLRGLVIPDKSSYSNQPKNLSTVFKNEFSGRPKVDNLSQSAGDPNFCKQTMNGDMMGSSAVNLMEPPWKLGNANANTLSTIPKYSPAFKRRSLQLAPSITSNSGIYSTTPAATSKFTNESCASSSLAKNTCQFSMATSKPVEPLLPELPSAVPSSELNTDVFQKKTVFNRETLKSGMKNDDHRRASQDSTLATNCMLNGFDNRTPKKFDKGVKKQSVEVKALSRLNNLIVDEKNGDPKLTNGVKEAVNGFISEALLLNGHQNKRNTFSAQDIKSPFSSTKFSSELGNDSCFEDDEEDLTSKSISPVPSTPSDDMQSDVSFLRCDDSGISYRDNTMRSRYARRTNSSDSALKSVSSDQKSYSATDDSWSDASSDSAERPLDPEFKPRKISQQRTVLKERENETDSVRNFRALAQTWQQRARKDDAKRSPSFDINKCDKNESSIPKYKYNVINTYSKTQIDSEIYPSTYIDLGRCKDQIMQKNSVNSKSWLMNNSKSLDGLDKIDQNNRKNIRVSNNARNAANIANNNSKIGYEKTISDSIKSNYLESAINDGSCNGGPTNIPTAPILHKRLSSIGSSISEGDYDSSPGEFNCTSPVTSPSEVYGSVSSLASNTSYSSIQEIQQLMEEAYHSLEESGRTDHQILIIVLHKEEFKFSTGLTVSGGSDYEQKEIIIHRIIKGGLAAKDGRLRKGDRILSINGRTLKNVTHRETLTMLKSPRSEITLVISRPKDQDSTEIDAQEYKLKSCPSIDALTEHLVTTRDEFEDKSQMFNVEIIKEGSGLGFSLEGGKDSPDGDHPLRIKKIFTGGAAEKCKSLRLGDEIVSVNNHNLNSMSRLEAWQFIKRLPEGRISLTVKHT